MQLPKKEGMSPERKLPTIPRHLPGQCDAQGQQLMRNLRRAYRR